MEPKLVSSSALLRFMEAKENVHYLVDNTSNVRRRENGQKNVFWTTVGLGVHEMVVC